MNMLRSTPIHNASSSYDRFPKVLYDNLRGFCMGVKLVIRDRFGVLEEDWFGVLEDVERFSQLLPPRMELVGSQQHYKYCHPDEQVQHLLGLLHGLIVYADQIDPNGPDEAEANDVKHIPRAVELRNAGIKFEQSDGGIKKIKFDPTSATIRLSPINITDHTKVLFRNLVAFEVCKASKIKYVTCYLSLMDELSDSDEDVAVLRRSNIVTNYLGSDAEVDDLFNGLCKGVNVSRVDVLGQLKQQVNVRYRSKFKVWFAELMKDHLSSPWRSLAMAEALSCPQNLAKGISYRLQYEIHLCEAGQVVRLALEHIQYSDHFPSHSWIAESEISDRW